MPSDARMFAVKALYLGNGENMVDHGRTPAANIQESAATLRDAVDQLGYSGLCSNRVIGPTQP